MIPYPDRLRNADTSGVLKSMPMNFMETTKVWLKFIQALEASKLDTHNWFLPIEEAEIVKECEYIFKGSTNKIKYINKNDYVKSN